MKECLSYLNINDYKYLKELKPKCELGRVSPIQTFFYKSKARCALGWVLPCMCSTTTLSNSIVFSLFIEALLFIPLPFFDHIYFSTVWHTCSIQPVLPTSPKQLHVFIAFITESLRRDIFFADGRYVIRQYKHRKLLHIIVRFYKLHLRALTWFNSFNVHFIIINTFTLSCLSALSFLFVYCPTNFHMFLTLRNCFCDVNVMLTAFARA